ncbi:Wd-40 repeat protein [Mycena sanguinolenta]|uniref:Wd-40 repeat protein n=1 Tax=Mycena sanguinolenta TaxID=230812 RepID=A0A8H7DHC3_9AGAR|nr:Wd-40 repeat protein [Mycena sanguinolenta]
MPMISSDDFFATWTHSLSSDFQQNGVPAESSDWVTETAKIKIVNHDGADRVQVVALSDDNALIAVGVRHEVRVYDIAASASEPRLVHTLPGYAGCEIGSLDFHPGGRKIAVGLSRRLPRRMESMLRVWDLDDPVEVSSHLDDAVEGAVAAASSALSQHWSREDLDAADLRTEFTKIIAGGQLAMDVRNGRVLRGHFVGSSNPFSHDGRSLLYLPAGDVVVLDVETLTERFRLAGHTDAIMWAETSPDDKVVATASCDETVRIWSMDSGEVIHVLTDATNQCWAGAFSPDGELVAVGAGDQMVRVWRVGTGELVHTLSGFSRWVRSLAFSPDGRHLAAGASGGTLRVFDVVAGECEQCWQVDVEKDQFARSFIEISGVQYNSRGDLFFSSTEGRVFGYRAVQNAKWEAAVLQHTNFATSKDSSMLIALSRDGRDVCVWKIK